jgi:hypothetical protein
MLPAEESRRKSIETSGKQRNRCIRQKNLGEKASKQRENTGIDASGGRIHGKKHQNLGKSKKSMHPA